MIKEFEYLAVFDNSWQNCFKTIKIFTIWNPKPKYDDSPNISA